MQRNALIALGVTVAVVSMGIWLLSDSRSFSAGSASEKAGTATAASKTSSVQSNGGLAPQNVLAIRPNAPKPTAAIETAVKGFSASASYKPSDLATRVFQKQGTAQALLAEIAAKPSDGEALRFKAEILARCATIKDDEWLEVLKENKQFAEKEKFRKSDPRAFFRDSLPTNSPDSALRLAAFDRLNPDFCAGIQDTQVSKAELNALYASAAKLGDVPSIAREFACDLTSATPKILPNQTMAEQLRQAPVKVEFTAARRAQLQELLRAGHPESMQYLMWAIDQGYSNGRIGLPGQNDKRDGGQRYAIKNALRDLIECDLGKPCVGQNNHALDFRCAHLGQCNLLSIPDAIHFHDLSPASSQSVETMRESLRKAIATGDFREMKFEPVKAGKLEDVYFSTGDEIGCNR